MPNITSIDRFQLRFSCLEELIEADNTVRFIDAFVDKLDLEKLGILLREFKTEGRPKFEESVFLKLYLYGYLNGIRSSRKLERECFRNIELQWLLGGLSPNYHSIADFRKENTNALKSLFKLYVLFLKECELIQGELLAVDVTKVRASNSKKNNYNEKKIERHLKYCQEKTAAYLGQLEENDINQDPEKVKNIQAKIERLSSSKINYERLKKELSTSTEPQISTTDPDSRALLVHGQVVEVCYNIQAAVDAKHSLVVGTHVLNRNDRNALSEAVLEAKNNIEVKEITVVADKGYHNGKELKTCQEAGVTTLVCPSELVNSNEHGTTKAYLVNKFAYDRESDSYTCPAGKTLTTTGSWHKKTRELNVSYEFKKYRTSDCKTCVVQLLCTGRQDGRREIERSEYAQYVEQNNKTYAANKQIYSKRQELNEHIFGTIKRQWGYYYTNLRGLEKVNAEFALVMTVYNIKRSLNIVGMSKLLNKLQNWLPDYEKVVICMKVQPLTRHFKPFEIHSLKNAA